MNTTNFRGDYHASGVSAPREIVHFLNQVRDEQISRIEGGTSKSMNGKLFEQATFKQALPEVSRVRLFQTLFAEYPQHKSIIEKFSEQKGVQSLSNICKIWDCDEDDAIQKLTQLEAVGFIKKQTDESWRIPFLYWPALSIVQGVSD